MTTAGHARKDHPGCKEATMYDTESPSPTAVDYQVVAESAPFLELRRRQRRFVFPLTIAFLAWYFGFVLVAAYLPEVMATPVVGVINVGRVLGLAQFATTFAITMWYVSYANRRLDPLAARIRTKLEDAHIQDVTGNGAHQ